MNIIRRTLRWLFLKVAVSLALAAAVAVVAAFIAFVAFPQVRAGVHTLLFVLQVLDVPVKPQSWFTREPVREEVAYPGPAGSLVADLYRIPDGRPRAGVLLFLGANAAGRDDAAVVNLGYAMSRAGFVTMIHWSPAMGQKASVDPGEIENLVWAFRYLDGLEYVQPGRVGMGGFSVGGSFALVSASDPRINRDIRFVNSLGSYFDAPDLFVQIASRSKIVGPRAGSDGVEPGVESLETEPWEVDALTRRVFTNELLEAVADPDQRAALARRYAEDADTSVDAALPELTGAAPLVKQLLEGTTPENARELLRQMPLEFREELEGISPSAHFNSIQARLLIMHDQGDKLIPVGESRRFAAAVSDREDALYTETSIFDHVRPGRGRNWMHLSGEAIKLYRHMYQVFRVAQ